MKVRNISILFVIFLVATFAIGVLVYHKTSTVNGHLILQVDEALVAAKQRLLLTRAVINLQQVSSTSLPSERKELCTALNNQVEELSTENEQLKDKLLNAFDQDDIRAEINTKYGQSASSLNELKQLTFNSGCLCDESSFDSEQEALIMAKLFALKTEILKQLEENLSLWNRLVVNLGSLQKKALFKYLLIGFIAICIAAIGSLVLGIRGTIKLNKGRKKAYDQQKILNKELDKNQQELKEAIAQLDESKAQIESSEANLYALMENSNQEIWAVNKEGVLLTCNSAFKIEFARLIGEIPHEGETNVFEMFASHAENSWKTQYDEAFSGQTVKFNFERKEDNRYFEVSINPIESTDTEVISVAGFVTDITDMVVATKEVKNASDRLDLALENSRQGMWDWNIKDNDLILNKTFAELLGYASNEIENPLEFWKNTVHDDYKEFFNSKVHQGAMTNVSGELNFEYKGLHKSGKEIWLRVMGKVVSYEEDRPSRVIGTLVDISERKAQEIAINAALENERELNEELKVREEELSSRESELEEYVHKLERIQEQIKENENRLKLIIEHLPVGAVLLQDEKLYLNQKTTQILEYTKDDISSPDEWFSVIYGKENAEIVRAQYSDILGDSSISNFLFPIYTKSGERRVVEFGAFDFEDGIVWTLIDVTDKRNAQKLLIQNEEAIRELYKVSANYHFNFEEKIDRMLSLGADRFQLSFGALCEVDTVNQKIYLPLTLVPMNLLQSL